MSQIPYFDSLFAALVVGSCGGLLGSLFIIVNNKVNILRKKLLDTKLKKIAEACLLITLTTSMFYLLSFFLMDCIPEDDGYLVKNGLNKQFVCEEGEYSPLASLFFNTQLNSIKTFMNTQFLPGYGVLVYFITWLIFVCLTSGSAVPCGIFLPCILIGNSLGVLYH